MIMLSCQNLSLARDGRILCAKLTFRLDKGELLIIRGHNGCGKTTLLKTILGFVRPAEGALLWQEKPLKKVRESLLAELCYIGHRQALKPELTVMENLAFWAHINGTEELIPATLVYFGLMDKQEMRCGILSEGWKKRVSLARLMLQPRSFWLLDEPFANLDKDGIALVENLISARTKQGGMVLLTTHRDTALAGKELDMGACV